MSDANAAGQSLRIERARLTPRLKRSISYPFSF
jgi:hypothetical protein